MNSKLKALLVWLMLLAVPLQGFASATRLLCAPPPAVAAHASVRGTPLQAVAAHAGVTPERSTGHLAAHHHADGKCGTCASCCFGAAITPSFLPALPENTMQFASPPIDARPLASVHLDLPERPPRA